MPVSLPGGEVGVFPSFRTSSTSFEAVRGEYLSRTQPLQTGLSVICSFTGHSASAVSTQMHSHIYRERGLKRGSLGSIKGNA